MSVDIAMWDDTGAQSLFSGSEVSGGRKTSQRLIINLMESAGEVFARSTGSNFVENLDNGAASEQQLFTTLAAGLYQAAQQTDAARVAADEDEEVFSRARINRLLISQDDLAVDMTVSMLGGPAVPIRVPLSFILEE